MWIYGGYFNNENEKWDAMAQPCTRRSLADPDWAFTANSPSLGLPTVESSTTVRLPT